MPASRSLAHLAACLLVVGAGGAGLASALTPVGGEFQVNSYTTGIQTSPVVAMRAGGDFVIAWNSIDQDGFLAGVFAQRFDATGKAAGAEFQVNTYTTYSQAVYAIAIDLDGDFVVVWQGNAQDQSYYGIFARRFDSAGAALGVEFQVNSYTIGFQLGPTVAMDDDGDFVVAWQSRGQDGSDPGIFARRFDSTGAGKDVEFQVNTFTPGYQIRPTAAIEGDGDFVVVWQSWAQDGSGYGIFARRFGSAGGALGVEFQVNSYTPSSATSPAIAIDGDGNFVVAWQSYGQDGDVSGVFARRFDATGVGQGAEFQVNTHTANSQSSYAGAVGMSDDGEFIVTWTSRMQEDFQSGIFARRFDAAGASIGGEFQVHTYTYYYQFDPAVGMDSDGDFVIAWSGDRQDGESYGVFAQRFQTVPALATLDVDGDGTVAALTDGLLVLRFQFGFTGATLVSGAVAGGCTRCDAAAIQTYLGGLGLALDVDGNGAVEPLTDGLFVLRFAFGFTGATLTSGAVGDGCTRCDSVAIEPYLATLV